MTSYAAQRRAMLREVFRLTQGDMKHPLWIRDLATSLTITDDAGGISYSKTLAIAQQLAAKRLVRVAMADAENGYKVLITMRGIEESERQEKPPLQRFATDHPATWPIIVSVVASLIALFSGKVYEAAFPKNTPAPIINNYIQLPDKTADAKTR